MAPGLDLSLYVILDTDHVLGRDLRELVSAICSGGATAIQYRAKNEEPASHEMALPLVIDVAEKNGVPLLVNDHLDLALRFGSRGIHLGCSDLPISSARKRAGESLVIGATVHTPEEALRAADSGADYLSVGSIYPTSTKKDIRVVGLGILETICSGSTLPTVAIGGITLSRIEEVLSRGADGVALISAVLDASDPGRETRRLRDRIEAFRNRPLLA